MLHPYEGPWVREQAQAVGRALDRSTYGADQSGTKRYRINSLGFRGEELRPDAERRIFVFGCSHSFGVGLEETEIWHSRFRDLYATRHGSSRERVNLLNFSLGGASNDFITRQLVTQCSEERPDLVLIYFTASNRTESHTSGQPLPIAPWMWKAWPLRVLVVLKRSWGRLGHARRFYLHLREVDKYYRHYTDEFGLLNAIRNVLLAQCYCRSEGIPYYCAWTDFRRLQEPAVVDRPPIARLAAQIDLSRFTPLTLDDPEVRSDTAVDGLHAGPRTHRRFAESCFESYLAHTPAARPC